MDINGNTGVIGIIGNPVRHTKSPLIHNLISDRLNKNMVYVPFEVKGDVSIAVKGAYELGIIGMNVTVPYKTDVIPSLCDIDEAAGKIGAVNTLVRTDKGYKGYNTDMLGLERALQSENVNIAKKTCVILGAGGAARAAAFMCVKNNAEKLYIVNRTIEKAEGIANILNGYIKEKGIKTDICTLSLNEYNKITENNLFVFQCTKIGLNEEDGAVIEDKNFYDKISVGVDLVYRDNTKFCEMTKESGGRAFNGLKMLMYQGIIAYELFNDLKVPKEVIEEVEKVLKDD